MPLEYNYNIKPYNSFGLDVIAKEFSRFGQVEDLIQTLEENSNKPYLVIGGGSNILFTKDFDGLILKNELKGIQLINQDADYYYVQAAAGEGWHDFVQFCIANNFAGLENLSLIPGCVGASPMQNIGAYGVEIKDVFFELDALHIKDLTIHTFKLDDCQFGYRESIFKRVLKNQYIILKVRFRLFKKPSFHIEYGAIRKELEKMGVQDLSIQAISEAVINIRRSKLPDPKNMGNAGSFFKNPTITTARFIELKEHFPDISGYASNEDASLTKVAAGWMIESCGWKGFRQGAIGVHVNQALVLVNYGDGKGQDIYDLSSRIIESVEKKFQISLEREVNIV